MKSTNHSAYNRIAALLALVIGLMAIFAGGRVLLGILPDYYVIDWLPVYNFIMGAVSAFFRPSSFGKTAGLPCQWRARHLELILR